MWKMWEIQVVLKRIFELFYSSIWNAFFLSFLFMYFFMSIRENGLKASLKKWKQKFFHHFSFVKVFLLAFYCSQVLTMTVLSREICYDPLSHLYSSWLLYDPEGYLQFDVIDNVLLFIPATFLLLWNLRGISSKKLRINKALFTIISAFLFSLMIEVIQLIGLLGTFQFSDLVYNTLGGFIGMVIYAIFSIIVFIINKILSVLR